MHSYSSILEGEMATPALARSRASSTRPARSSLPGSKNAHTNSRYRLDANLAHICRTGLLARSACLLWAFKTPPQNRPRRHVRPSHHRAVVIIAGLLGLQRPSVGSPTSTTDSLHRNAFIFTLESALLLPCRLSSLALQSRSFLWTRTRSSSCRTNQASHLRTQNASMV
jgi:hypothetical protein